MSHATTSFEFPLPDGRHFRAAQNYFRQYQSDWVVWAGDVRDVSQSADGSTIGTLMLSVYQGRVSGVAHIGDTDYSLLPEFGSNLGRLQTMGHGSAVANCPVADHVDALPSTAPQAPFLSTRKSLGECLPAGTLPTQHVIDVMSLYTRDFLISAPAEAQVQSFITTAIANANLIFARSRVPTEYRLVHMGPLPPSSLQLNLAPETQGNDDNKAISKALEWMNDQPAELTSLRNAYGADLVSLFIPSVIDTVNDRCGRANLPVLISGTEKIRRLSGVYEPFNGRAFTAQEVDCGQTDYTYAHEHGHNFGMSHTGSDANLIYSYGSGHVLNPGEKGSVATVMGCVLNGTNVPNGVCQRIANFSDPNVCHDGVPTGTETAKNAEVARLRSPGYAAMRATVTNATPNLTISAPTDGAVVGTGQSLTLVASATDPGAPDLTPFITWRSDREPIYAQGSPVTIALQVAGQHVLTATITDSGNKRVERSVRVVVQGGPPEIRLTQAGIDYLDGSTYVYPTLAVDALPYTRVFSICNTGSSGLTLANTQLVSGANFTQLGQPASLLAPGVCTSLSIQFQASQPGTFTGSLQIANNDSNENPYDVALSATAAPSNVQLVASYVPSLGGARTTYASSSTNAPSFDYYFDPNQGRFEERPGAPCHAGITNPNYLRVRLGGSVLNTGGISGCTFQASWDSVPYTCSVDLVNALNSGQEFIINTDDANQDLTTCAEHRDPQYHVRQNQVHWLQVNFDVGPRTYVRRVTFKRKTNVIRAVAVADTYVTEGAVSENNAAQSYVQVRGGSGTQRFGFMRFAGSSAGVGVSVRSAQLRLMAIGMPMTQLSVRAQVSNAPWVDGVLAFSNWNTITGGDTGSISSAANLAANRTVGFDVSGSVNTVYPSWAYVFRATTSDTRDLRWIGSAENGTSTAGALESRPVLHITTE
ncbi:zinc-dependent metalloprotease family protein [Ahniella affigens]|uniref:zinc-dependent metalloprotease family protein n=1 Tax=Ahniella affigens TaxID=2021234 RepID=UPI001475177A|nr:zinc-dependent metalloprotease family protein [Ahniella affigens]